MNIDDLRLRVPVANAAVLLIVPIVAVGCEVFFGSIPNLLTLPAIVVGLTLGALSGSAGGRFAAAALAVVPGASLWSLGLVGAGAAKLLIAVGALTNVRFVAVTWVATAALLGGAVLLVLSMPDLLTPEAAALPVSPAVTVVVIAQVVWLKQQHGALPGFTACDAPAPSAEPRKTAS